jgi:uncharacterized membrane protein
VDDAQDVEHRRVRLPGRDVDERRGGTVSRVSTEWPLFLHLVGAFLFVGGSITAATLRVGAIRRALPSEQALLLRAVRPLVPVVAGGLLVTLAAGFWLVEELGLDYGAAWLSATFALVAWLLVVGAVAGRSDRRTRELAERLAADGDRPSDELARRLRDPVSLALNASLLVAIVAIVALMVWKPS